MPVSVIRLPPPALETARAMPKSATSARAVVQQDVLGLDVAVDHAVAVGVVERVGDFGRDPDRIVDRELLLAGQPIAQRFALDERHHVVSGAVHFARVDQAEDVRMLQGRDRLDLAQEPLGTDDRGELGLQDLDGDLAVVLEILREIDGGHAARAELALDAIAVGQSC